MIRFTFVASLLLLATRAGAQQVDGGLGFGSAPPADMGPGPTGSSDLESLKRDLLDQARKEAAKEADEKIQKAKDDMRAEVRAELANQSAKTPWEDEWQEQKKKLDLIEVNGYLRVRPVLLYNMDLGIGRLPKTYGAYALQYNTQGPVYGITGPGGYLFPRTLNDANITDPTSAQTEAWADMRMRVEPTLNISEDIKIRSQIDLLNNLILGSTPEIDNTYPLNLMSLNQVTPANAVLVRRVWGEVNTPVGLLSFGRMGDQWGMGIFHNDGNCLDCDYGDTIDRIMFTARLAGFYLMPMIDYVGKGASTSNNTFLGLNTNNTNVYGLPTNGSSIDATQEDDVNGPFNGPALSAIVARRDTDKEAQRKLDNGEFVFNYGLYYSYRHQTYEWVPNSSPNTLTENNMQNGTQSDPYLTTAILRTGYVHEPDLWAKFMTKRLKIEAEVAAVLGAVNNASLGVPGIASNQTLNIYQFGGAARGEYKFLDGALTISLEYGVASGDKNTQLGVGTPYNTCSPVNIAGKNTCTITASTNFVFNPDYRVDDILWREILGSMTDAMYAKPGVRYQIAEGFDVFLYAIYSRSIFTENTIGNNNNLGVEFDPGVSYTSDDGFIASLHYAGLIPLAGFNNAQPYNPANTSSTITELTPNAAHALRMTLAIKF